MKIGTWVRRTELVTALGVVVLVAAVAIVSPAFASPANLVRVLNAAVILSLLAAGAAVVIMTRNIDVSMGSVLALTGIVGAMLLRDGYPPVVAILAMTALGVVLGIVNGVGVTYGHVPSIVMTLGTLGAFRGISFLITGGYSLENLPSSYRQIGSAKLAGVPLLVWIALATFAILTVFMSHTRTGRHIYATGDNLTGARLIGVRTNAVVICAYAMSGLLAALGAVVFLAQVGSVSNQAGVGIEMRAIAAAVIGGVALTGGVGTVLGAGIGALFVTAAISSLSFLGIPGFWADTVIGSILLIALFADARMRRALEHRRISERYRARQAEVSA